MAIFILKVHQLATLEALGLIIILGNTKRKKEIDGHWKGKGERLIEDPDDNGIRPIEG